MSERTRFEELRGAQRAEAADLDTLWARLETVAAPEMLGAWRGGDFATGHPASALLKRLGWHGKRFDSVLDGHPLICRDAAGALYSNTKAAGGGGASLWDVAFRGEITATMVYDAMPVFDHFKRVDADTVMGIMNGKLESAFGTGDLYYFWLEREQ